jgi:putative FmdB family regulatory protein
VPFYEYEPKSRKRSCKHCKAGFEIMQRLAEEPLTKCPECGAPVRRVISSVSIGSSKSGLTQRAKDAGFHQLKKLGKGEYEKTF